MNRFSCILICCLVALAMGKAVKKNEHPDAQKSPDLVNKSLDKTDEHNSSRANTTLASPELTSAAGCPRDFVSFSLLPNSCYGFIDNDRIPFTWYDAASVCATYNSRLVDYQSSDEEALVVSYYRANMYDAANRHFWIGANDLMKPGSWGWAGIDKPITYSNWYNRDDDRYYNCAFAHKNYNFRWYGYVCWHDTEPLYNAVCKAEKQG